MKYRDSCLTCLGNSKEMRHINSIITIAGYDVRLSDILLNFYDYKVRDHNFPENVCITCTHQLTITYSFKVLIESCSKTLYEKLYEVESIDQNDHNIESEDDIIIPNQNRSHKAQRREQRKPTVKAADIGKEPQLLFCVECKSQFCTVQSLNEHCTNNHPVKSLIGRDCEYCSEKFEDFRTLVVHRKLHLKPYLCENCWEGFYNSDDLHNHSCLIKDNNKDTEKPDKVLKQCDQCGKSYPPGYIRIHMLTHSDNRPYHCKFCPKKFKVPGGLHSHVLWNHKRTRNHKCEICNATFISSSSRSSHIRKNHLKEKKYACKCGKRFFSKSELERHTLTHTGVKNFHCHLCDKSYQTRYGLNVHLKSHSQMSMNILGL